MKWIYQSTIGLITIVSIVFAIAMFGVGAVVYEISHEALEEQLDHRIYAEMAALEDEAKREGAAALVEAVRRRVESRDKSGLLYLLLDSNGRTISGNLDGQAPEEEGYLEYLPHRGGSGLAQSLTTKLPGDMKLVVAADRQVIADSDQTMKRLGWGAIAVTLLLAIVAFWTISAVTRKRLHRIDSTARAIIRGDLSRRIEVTGSNNEFDRVSATLNEMLDRTQDLVENLKQVSSDVAHDLRTPLTKLINSLNQATATSDAGARDQLIESALKQSNELHELFSAILRISEVESLQVRRRFSELDLSSLLEDVVESYGPDAELTGHVIQTGIEPDVRIEGDRRLLRQMVTNALDNELRHTPDGTLVKVDLSIRQKEVVLEISDNGPGVALDEVPHLFKRFHRAEKSRTVSGNGLGLSLVAAIAHAHWGSAQIHADNGFRLSIVLPLPRPAA